MSLTLGPLSLAAAVVLVLFAFGVAVIVGGLVGRRSGIPIAATLTDVLLAGAVSARVVFVALYFEHYRESPLGILDIRDGGFDPVGGVLGTLAMTAFLLWRRPAVRGPLLAAVAAGLITWGGSRALIGLLEHQARQLPAVEVNDLAGRPLDLAEIASGQPRVVNLWATWCPPCIREMPVLQAGQARYPGVAFVFVNQGESAERVRAFLDAQSLTLQHVYLDAGMRTGHLTGSQALPTTLFYDARGRLVDTHLGELSAATLARALERFPADAVASPSPVDPSTEQR